MINACIFTWDEPSFMSGCRSWAERILPLLEPHGVKPSVLYVAAPSGKPEAHVRLLESSGIACRPLPLKASWTTAAAVESICREMAAIRADVFIPNFWLPGYYAVRSLRAMGVETIGVMHSDDSYYWALVDEFVRGDAEYRCRHWVAVSSYLRDELRRRALSRESLSVEMIPSGVRPATRFATEPKDELRIGYAGRIVQEAKRILDVAKSMVRLAGTFPRVRCEIIGGGSEERQLTEYLNVHAKDLPVRYLGAMSAEEAVQHMADWHVLLLLSDYEGLSVALTEAMAAGVVPVCVDCRSGLRDLVQDGANGFIVQDRDSDVVRAVGRLLQEPGLWSSMSIRARSSISGIFLVETGAERWARVIQRATGSHPPGAAPPGDPAHQKPVQLPPVHPQLEKVDTRDAVPPGEEATWREDCFRRREESNRALEEWQDSRRMWLAGWFTNRKIWDETWRVRREAELAAREGRFRASSDLYVAAAEVVRRDIRSVPRFLRRDHESVRT